LTEDGDEEDEEDEEEEEEEEEEEAEEEERKDGNTVLSHRFDQKGRSKRSSHFTDVIVKAGR